MLLRLFAAAALAVALPMKTPAADLPPGFVQKSHANADGTMSPYVVYVPPGYDPKSDEAKPLPVILFLHGSGAVQRPRPEAGQAVPGDRRRPAVRDAAHGVEREVPRRPAGDRDARRDY